MDKQNIRWIILFCVLIGVFYWLDQSAWFHQVILIKLSRLNADATSWALSFLGLPVETTNGAVVTASGRFEIAESCTGSFVFMMYAAAILPFPTPWKSRLSGLLLGLVTLLLINLLRTSLIILVASRFPQSFWTFHIIVGQVIVIVGMMAIFLWWAKSNVQNHPPSLFKNNRAIFWALALFCTGYLCGYGLYRIFLDSSFGLWVKGLIETHSFWIMSVLSDRFSLSHPLLFSFQKIKLIEGCLSSPMVVVFVAVVFAWPTNWWRRGAIILLGFVPFFYVYHLLRTLLVSVTLGFQPKEVNFIYNFYGQMLLTIALFAWIAYLWCSKQKTISYGKFLRLFAASGLTGIVAALGLGWFALHIIIPFLTHRISGSPLLSYNPDQVISTMTNLLVFIWLSLVGATPGLSRPRKWLLGSVGILVALTGLTGVVLLIETFQLAPHKGILKAAIILLPFVVYYFWCFPSKKEAATENKAPHIAKNKS